MPFTIRPQRRFPAHCVVTSHSGPLLFLSFLPLTILLWLNAVPANAEWMRLTEADGMTVHFDPDAIRRKGNLVKVWLLYDYKTLQSATGVAHLSDSIQLEANCTEKLQRSLAYTWWSGNMGNGNVVFSQSAEGNWIPIGPGTVGHTVWSFACSKK